MTFNTALPFVCKDMPCPLPSEDEIDQGVDITLAYGGRRVVEVGPHLIVKYGISVNLIEGENMLFAAKNTAIPVPKVYALYSSARTGKKYIVMQRIQGQTLESLWPTLGSTQKKTIISIMQGYFTELRRLPSPGYYGSLGNRPLLNDIFWTKTPTPTINGPFTGQNAVIEAMAQKYTHDGRPPYRADLFRRCLPQILSDQGPIFTHGHFQRKNVMVQMGNHASDVQDSQNIHVTLIDWEKAGWYPHYWEFCMSFCSLRWDNDWALWIDKALAPCYSEAGWMTTLYSELWS